MGPLALDFDQLQEQLGELLAEVLLGAQLTVVQDNPAPLLSAFGQVLHAMSQLDRQVSHPPAEIAGDTAQTATTLGESASRLLSLTAEAMASDARRHNHQFAVLYVGFAYWVARHGGNTHDLSSLVGHLMHLESANSADCQIDTDELASTMLALIDSLAAYRKAEAPNATSMDPCDPWRLLHLLTYATAQRSQRTDLIRQAILRLSQNLPGDRVHCVSTARDLPTTPPSIPKSHGTRSAPQRRDSHKPTLH